MNRRERGTCEIFKCLSIKSTTLLPHRRQHSFDYLDAGARSQIGPWANARAVDSRMNGCANARQRTALREHRVDRVVWRLLCHPRSRRFEGRSHTVKFFQTPRQGHPSGYRRTTNFRRGRLAGIYQHALEPNMPPSNFFGLRHGTSPRSNTKFAGDIKVPECTRNAEL